MMRFFKELRRSFTPTLDFLLPPLCVACHARIDAAHALCSACWAKLDFIAKPYCVTCGIPFAFTIDEAAVEIMQCGSCLEEQPVFAKARAPLRYDDAARSLLLPFKHSDQTHLAPHLGKLMQKAGQELLDECDAILPVPLHFFRLFARRYNQSVLLADRLGQWTAKPVWRDLLVRKKATESQGRLTRQQRFDNVRGVFAVTEKGKAQIKDKVVLLVDDVMTTGATAGACAKALRQAGAAKVHVLVVARVSKAE